MISRENDPNWHEACNPLIPNARGLVPNQSSTAANSKNCGMDYETEDFDWSSEENSNSRVNTDSGEDLDSKDDPDSNA